VAKRLTDPLFFWPFIMPKQLELARPAMAQGGVLIKHADLQTGLRASRLIHDARRRAQRILREAEQDAADYQRQGYLQGYGEGVLSGADALVRALDDARTLRQQLSDSLQQALREQLEAILPQPELGLALARDWLLSHPEIDLNQVALHIPEGWQQAGHVLGQHFGGLPGARMHFHSGRHFAIEHGHSVYEFSPDAAIGDWQRDIFRRIGLQHLSDESQRVTESALAQLWQHWHTGPAEDAEAGSMTERAENAEQEEIR